MNGMDGTPTIFQSHAEKLAELQSEVATRSQARLNWSEQKIGSMYTQSNMDPVVDPAGNPTVFNSPMGKPFMAGEAEVLRMPPMPHNQAKEEISPDYMQQDMQKSKQERALNLPEDM